MASNFWVRLIIHIQSETLSLWQFIYINLPSITWSIQILFLVLVFLTSVLFEDLNSQIATILESSGPSGNIAKKLEIWRRKHVVICELVDNINDCFGIVLLISLGSYFVYFNTDIYTFCYLVFKLFRAEEISPVYRKVGSIKMILNVIRNLTNFVLLMSIAHRMQRKVIINIASSDGYSSTYII